MYFILDIEWYVCHRDHCKTTAMREQKLDGYVNVNWWTGAQRKVNHPELGKNKLIN